MRHWYQPSRQQQNCSYFSCNERGFQGKYNSDESVDSDQHQAKNGNYVRDYSNRYAPTLQEKVPRAPWSKLSPVFVMAVRVRYNGQVVRLTRKSDTAMLT